MSQRNFHLLSFLLVVVLSFWMHSLFPMIAWLLGILSREIKDRL